MQGKLKLTVGRVFSFGIPCYIHKPRGRHLLTLEVSVTSRDGRLNPQTGEVIPLADIDEAVNAVLDRFKNDKIDNLDYLPQTLEIFVEKIWDWVEEELGYSVSLDKVKLSHPNTLHHPNSFVEYSRVERELLRQPQPQPQPQPQTQPKLRKPRKKYRRKNKE